MGNPERVGDVLSQRERAKEIGEVGVRGENSVNTGPSNCRHILCVVNVKHQVVITATGLA